MDQPKLKIGIMAETELRCSFKEAYQFNADGRLCCGDQTIQLVNGQIHLNGEPLTGDNFLFEPVNENLACFELSDVTIGVQFHWERKETQLFKGALQILKDGNKIQVINILPLEDYLVSVISSEMSATSSLELLKAHAIISRSWLIAQVVKEKVLGESGKNYQTIYETPGEYIRWYDREDHKLFDVCADDHCQRYQGITRQTSMLVEKAVNETSGMVLLYDGQVCDARFSKSCGGVTETFEKVWEPVVHQYLQTIHDHSEGDDGLAFNLTEEIAAGNWIRSSPAAFCNTKDHHVLSQVLNDYDQETIDFYRWKVAYSQEEISALVARKTGFDFGQIIDLVPKERGHSGRIIKLEIIGSKRKLTVGKELEIRKILSASHLYSSAFVVDRLEMQEGVPGKFLLTGAGWGHGVGLCQIGAAMMGEKGFAHGAILNHYFVGAKLEKVYDL